MDLFKWPRQTDIKDHDLYKEEHFGQEAPCVLYELRPVLDPKGNPVDGLNTAWVILNNPALAGQVKTALSAEMKKG